VTSKNLNQNNLPQAVLIQIQHSRLKQMFDLRGKSIPRSQTVPHYELASHFQVGMLGLWYKSVYFADMNPVSRNK